MARGSAKAPAKKPTPAKKSTAKKAPAKKPTPAKKATKKVMAIEEIVGQRTHKGKLEYQVKWVGFGHKDNTWEPPSQVSNLWPCAWYLSAARPAGRI